MPRRRMCSRISAVKCSPAVGAAHGPSFPSIDRFDYRSRSVARILAIDVRRQGDVTQALPHGRRKSATGLKSYATLAKIGRAPSPRLPVQTGSPSRILSPMPIFRPGPHQTFPFVRIHRNLPRSAALQLGPEENPASPDWQGLGFAPAPRSAVRRAGLENTLVLLTTSKSPSRSSPRGTREIVRSHPRSQPAGSDATMRDAAAIRLTAPAQSVRGEGRS